MKEEIKLPISGTKVLRSEELFSGNRDIVIEHSGFYYRLMITKSGKLILNKYFQTSQG